MIRLLSIYINVSACTQCIYFYILVPKRCCVPGCFANYDTWLKENKVVSAFKFPENEDLRTKWQKAIPRGNWTPTRYSYVCILHFKDDDFRSHPRKKLCQSAIPSIFPSTQCRAQRKTNISAKRKPPIQRLELEPAAQEPVAQGPASQDPVAQEPIFFQDFTTFQTEKNSTVKLNEWMVHKVGKLFIVTPLAVEFI